MLRRIGNLIVKELIQFGRDRLLTTFILLAPALQLILMAQNIERGIREQPVVLLDLDRSRLSRQLGSGLENTDELSVRFYVDGLEDVRELLDGGQARLAVIIPVGFARELGNSHTPLPVQIIADATNTMAASVTMRAAAGVVGRFSADLTGSFGQVTPEFVDFRTKVPFNPTLDYRDSTIPAQLGFITYQVSLAVAALGLARERELGTLEQLMVTPLRRSDLAIGKGIPAIAVGGMNFAVMWGISLTLFQVPMNGSPALLVGLTLLFITAIVSWGVVISSISRTQQQAILMVFILAMVDMAFSGFMVPVRNMPPLFQAVSRFVPLRYYLTIVRSIMLKGASLQQLWPEVAALAALCVALVTLALFSVARRVE
jgi:ABC-2 type transport system permease protein